MKVGFIGLGAMGAPMARYVHNKGLLTAVGNRTQAKADALAAELSVRAARSAANFADCDVVVLCVSLDADVLENVTALADVLKPGAVVIDHSTVAVDTARRAAAMLAAQNIGFLDAPVSGGVEGARNGKLSVMVGGEIDTFDRAQPVIETYAARVTHMGGTGAGQATKAVNQVLVAGINEAVCEGLGQTALWLFARQATRYMASASIFARNSLFSALFMVNSIAFSKACAASAFSKRDRISPIRL